MSNKKHIDRIFQEKLKDFEVGPSPKVWQNIKSELEQSDQNKKRIPIWFRLAGVAAILIILLTIGNAVVSNSSDAQNDIIVDTENTRNTPKILNTPNYQLEKTKNDFEKLQKSSQNLNSTTENDAYKNSNVTTSKSSKFGTNILNNDAVVDSDFSKINSDTEDKNKGVSSQAKASKNKNTFTHAQKNSLASENQTPHNVAQNKITLNPNSENTRKSNIPNDSNKISTSSTQEISSGITQSNSTINTSSDNTNKDTTPNNINDFYSSPTITDGVAQTNNDNQKNLSNSTQELDKAKAESDLKNRSQDVLAENQSYSEEQENIVTEEETDENSPSIEEAIANAEDIIEEEEKVNRWQVYANVAPVYYNTLGKGSHIDDQFVQNSKSGEFNMSYGVNVSYVLNDKLKLRSGLNTLDLSYDTDNVILYENVSNNSNYAIRNLDLSSTGESFSAISATNLGAQQISDGIGGNANAAISQRLAYYEVPLELEYNLVDRKFGLNVIGGVSTFILNDNAVYSEFEGFKTEVGEANNINDISFSGNLGLGLDYKFSDKIILNVQPTFKYQLNAYKNTSGNFRPYIVGVYTGLSYKF